MKIYSVEFDFLRNKTLDQFKDMAQDGYKTVDENMIPILKQISLLNVELERLGESLIIPRFSCEGHVRPNHIKRFTKMYLLFMGEPTTLTLTVFTEALNYFILNEPPKGEHDLSLRPYMDVRLLDYILPEGTFHYMSHAIRMRYNNQETKDVWLDSLTQALADLVKEFSTY